MFKCAKYFHDLSKETHGSQIIDDSDIDRAFIRRWKTKIYRFLEYDRKISVNNFDNYKENEIFDLVVK